MVTSTGAAAAGGFCLQPGIVVIARSSSPVVARLIDANVRRIRGEFVTHFGTFLLPNLFIGMNILLNDLKIEWTVDRADGGPPRLSVQVDITGKRCDNRLSKMTGRRGKNLQVQPPN